MSPLLRPRPASERVVWRSAMVASVVAGLVWTVATPLFTGPDEVSQARRAAAVVRGELTGRQDRPGPPLLLTVDVPWLYGEPADQNWLCHLGPLVPGTPQEPMLLPSPPCPDLRNEPAEPVAASALVEAHTVQYRGQPFFYGLVGLPTLLSDGVTGAYGMRVVTVLVTAALVASAAVTVAGARRRGLVGVGLLACLTPGVLYLSGSTNPSAVEIAAALSAWAAVGMLASADASTALGSVRTGSLIARLGVSLTILTLCRGLGPGFAAAVVAAGAAAAGLTRCRELAHRPDVRRWAMAVGVATGASLAWLLFISSSYPLPERSGSGFADALGWLPWYLRQSVGVFGTNDSAVSHTATFAWCAVVLTVFAVGAQALIRGGSSTLRRQAAIAGAALGGGLVMNVTAEGLSLPPIGFFWQGRYALPLLLGGVILAITSASPTGTGTDRTRFAAGPVAALASVGGVAALIAVHGHALLVVTAHHGSPTGALRWTALLVYVTALAALAGTVIARPTRPDPMTEPG